MRSKFSVICHSCVAYKSNVLLGVQFWTRTMQLCPLYSHCFTREPTQITFSRHFTRIHWNSLHIQVPSFIVFTTFRSSASDSNFFLNIFCFVRWILYISLFFYFFVYSLNVGDRINQTQIHILHSLELFQLKIKIVRFNLINYSKLSRYPASSIV